MSKNTLTPEEMIEKIAEKVIKKIDEKQAKAAELKVKQPFSVCIKCGHPFTQNEDTELECCPECGETQTVRLQWSLSE